MAGTRNDTHYSQGYNLTPTSDPAVSLMQMTPNTCQTINTSGSPNGSKSGNPGSICQDQSGNLWVKQTGTGNTGWVLVTTSATDLHTAKFIVGDVTNGANYSTIQAAINAATSGDTVFIQTGTYTEDLTLKAGVNLVGFNGDQGMWKKQTQFNTQIIGKITANYTGFCNISNLCLTTNGDNCVHALGSGTVLTLTNCMIRVVDAVIGVFVENTATDFSMFYCFSTIQITGGAYFSIGISCILRFCDFAHNATPVSPSLVTGGVLQVAQCNISREIITSNSSSIAAGSSLFGSIETTDSSLIFLDQCSTTNLAFNSASTSFIQNCVVNGGSNTAITIDTAATLNMSNTTVFSNATDAISGTGTLIDAGTIFTGTSSSVNVSTMTGFPVRQLGGVSGQVWTSNGPNAPATFQNKTTASTWIPTLSFGGGSTGITYNVQIGDYVVVGKMCYITCKIDLTNKGSSVGACAISGLPFTVSENAGGLMVLRVIEDITLDAGFTYSGFTPSTGLTEGIIVQCGSGIDQQTLNETNFSNTTEIQFSGVYRIV